MVLKHEQGHYDIAYLLKCEAYSVLSSRDYDSNYQAEIAAIFNNINAKYQQMNAQYETETANMTNIKNQQKWNAWFDSQPCLQVTTLAKANY